MDICSHAKIYFVIVEREREREREETESEYYLEILVWLRITIFRNVIGIKGDNVYPSHCYVVLECDCLFRRPHSTLGNLNKSMKKGKSLLYLQQSWQQLHIHWSQRFSGSESKILLIFGFLLILRSSFLPNEFLSLEKFLPRGEIWIKSSLLWN